MLAYLYRNNTESIGRPNNNPVFIVKILFLPCIYKPIDGAIEKEIHNRIGFMHLFNHPGGIPNSKTLGCSARDYPQYERIK